MNWLKKLLCKWFKIGCPTPPSNDPITPCRSGLLFGYFGVQDGQMAEVGDHTNIAMIGSWGDWTTPEGRAALTDTMVRYAHEALAAGVNRIMFTVDWCLFTQTNPRKLLPEQTAVSRLVAFFDRLRTEGLDTHAFAWYLVDEPNIPEVNLSEQQMTSAIATFRGVANSAQFPSLNNLPIGVIYGGTHSGRPGIHSIDWAGIDNYGAPIFTNGEYDALVAQLVPGQYTILVPGGNDPWREDPVPFYNYAQTDPWALMIMPFKWFGNDGIGQNGMAPQYRTVGQLVKTATP